MTDLLAIHGKVAIISRVPLCGQINTINTSNRKLFPIRWSGSALKNWSPPSIDSFCRPSENRYFIYERFGHNTTDRRHIAATSLVCSAGSWLPFSVGRSDRGTHRKRNSVANYLNMGWYIIECILQLVLTRAAFSTVFSLMGWKCCAIKISR